MASKKTEVVRLLCSVNVLNMKHYLAEQVESGWEVAAFIITEVSLHGPDRRRKSRQETRGRSPQVHRKVTRERSRGDGGQSRSNGRLRQNRKLEAAGRRATPAARGDTRSSGRSTSRVKRSLSRNSEVSNGRGSKGRGLQH